MLHFAAPKVKLHESVMPQIEIYRVRSAAEIPQSILVPLDRLDDGFLAGFDNYPATVYLVIVS